MFLCPSRLYFWAYMSRFLFFLVTGAILLLVQPAPCAAASSSLRWWDNPEIVEAVALTLQQRQQITTLIQQSQERRAELSQRVRKLRPEISRLLSEPELREQRLFTTLATLSELRKKQREDLITMRLRVRQVLSPSQFIKLLEQNPNIMRQRWVPRMIHVRGASPAPELEKEPTTE
jgi:Spy/CpxP family protein refolding chaperone